MAAFFVISGAQAVKVSADRVDLFLPAEMSAVARAAVGADVAWASGLGIPARIVDSEAAANFVVELVSGASEFDCGGNLGVACTIVEYSLAGGWSPGAPCDSTRWDWNVSAPDVTKFSTRSESSDTLRSLD